jgi:L-ascorbate metabolism protein UlaG (beta-lactamase superfamily)
MGIVWLRMSWGVRQSGGDQLTVWETFKVYDGQIHAVEAFMRILPVALANGGWDEGLVHGDLKTGVRLTRSSPSD